MRPKWMRRREKTSARGTGLAKSEEMQSLSQTSMIVIEIAYDVK